MKTKDIRELTDDELKTRLAELKNELFNLRFRHATGQLENPVSLRNCKKDIAKVKTIKSTHRFKAHDEKNECGVGDKVRIVETRKLSKDKNWRVAEIIEKAK